MLRAARLLGWLIDQADVHRRSRPLSSWLSDRIVTARARAREHERALRWEIDRAGQSVPAGTAVPGSPEGRRIRRLCVAARARLGAWPISTCWSPRSILRPPRPRFGSTDGGPRPGIHQPVLPRVDARIAADHPPRAAPGRRPAPRDPAANEPASSTDEPSPRAFYSGRRRCPRPPVRRTWCSMPRRICSTTAR